ncbi:MAG: hypothetical protein ACR2PL_03115, partial [Dehalococcoidia bacterium]
ARRASGCARRQDSTGVLRGRPANSVGAILFSYIGAVAPTDPKLWFAQGTTGKTLFDVTFDSALAPGTTVWLWAQWLGTRLETGPACTAVGITFGAAGMFSLAA